MKRADSEPARPGGTQPHTVDAHGIQVGDFIRFGDRYRRVKNMLSPQPGLKVLHFDFGPPMRLDGCIQVHRKIQLIHPAKRWLPTRRAS